MKIFAFGAAAFFAGAAFAAAVTLSENTVEMPTYPFFDPDPVPCTGVHWNIWRRTMMWRQKPRWCGRQQASLFTR